MSDKTAPTIDCFRVLVPETDPLGAAAYAKMMRPMFDFEIPDFAKGAPFSSVTDVYRLPDATVSQTTTSASRLTRSLKTIARSAADQVLVLCYRSGGFTFETGGVTRRVKAGELAVFDLSQEVVFEAAVVDNISLAISRRKLEALFPVVDHAHGFVLEPCPLTTVLFGMIRNVLMIGAAIPLAEGRAIADAMVQLAAACLDMPSTAANAGNGTISLIAIKAAIERRLSDSALGPQTLLDEFGITRSTLYRLFEPFGGVSAYIMERRLRHAFRRMTDPLGPSLRISQLAFDLGFSHPSAFTRAFKGFFGVSPKDALALAVSPERRELLFLATPEARPYLHPIGAQAQVDEA